MGLLEDEIVDLHVPMKKARVRMKSLPWISREIRVLMRARTYHLTKAKRSKRMEDWVRFKSFRNQLKQSLKRAKREYS